MRWIKPNVRGFVLFALVTVLGACAADSAREEQQPAGQNVGRKPLPNPVIGTHELMELFSEPIYHALRDLLKDKPADDKQWGKVADQAYQAAEVANLIAIRKEAAEHKRWKELAEDAQQAAVKLVQTAEQKDYPAARQAYVSLITQCNDCHQATEPDHAPVLKPFEGATATPGAKQ